MTGKLYGKTVLVTGASRGYGRRFARALSQEGANVALTSRNFEDCERVARIIRADGARALAIEADVVDADAVAAMAEAVIAEFGGIDHLINNAGHPGTLHEFADLKPADWETPMRINLIGSFNCSQAVLPAMTARGSGVIVNMSSLVAQPHWRFYRSLPYTVSKYAIEGLSRTTAVKLKPFGIRCYAFIPGLSHTRFLDGIEPGFLKGITCQYVRHVEQPMVHLLSADSADCPPLGESFNALTWLDAQGMLEELTYVHDGGITPEEDQLEISSSAS